MVVLPLLFRLPPLGRYVGYALVRTILLRHGEAPDDLITHELCHIWQCQHRPVHMLHVPDDALRDNPYEVEARWAVEVF